MSPNLYAILMLAAFALAGLGAWLDVRRQCAKAQHELTLDAIWDDEEPA